MRQSTSYNETVKNINVLFNITIYMVKDFTFVSFGVSFMQSTVENLPGEFIVYIDVALTAALSTNKWSLVIFALW